MSGSLFPQRTHRGAHCGVIRYPPLPASSPALLPLRAGEGNSFLLRRLHSLTGIVPIGAFLLEHFISNYEAFKDRKPTASK